MGGQPQVVFKPNNTIPILVGIGICIWLYFIAPGKGLIQYVALFGLVWVIVIPIMLLLRLDKKITFYPDHLAVRLSFKTTNIFYSDITKVNIKYVVSRSGVYQHGGSTAYIEIWDSTHRDKPFDFSLLFFNKKQEIYSSLKQRALGAEFTGNPDFLYV